MQRPKTVYRGKRKYSWIVTLVVFVFVILILLAAWMFTYLQRFLVYDKDGLELVMPSERLEQISAAADGIQHRVLPRINVEIVVDRTDYSGAETTAGNGLTPLHALRVPAAEINESNLDYYTLGIGDFNAVILQLKGPDGFLRYKSDIALAESYGVNGDFDIRPSLTKLKSKDVYLIAEISTLIDETMVARNSPIALKNAVTGSPFQNSRGAWLDPYDTMVRAYLADMLTELAGMGFDEVIVTGLFCPDTENLQFSKSMTLTPDVCSAVSSLAMYLRTTADALGIRLSAAVEAEELAAGTSESIGQDLSVFFKAFDRITYNVSDADSAACMGTLKTALGDDTGDLRIVPAAENYAPNHGSYIVE